MFDLCVLCIVYFFFFRGFNVFIHDRTCEDHNFSHVSYRMTNFVQYAQNTYWLGARPWKTPITQFSSVWVFKSKKKRMKLLSCFFCNRDVYLDNWMHARKNCVTASVTLSSHISHFEGKTNLMVSNTFCSNVLHFRDYQSCTEEQGHIKGLESDSMDLKTALARVTCWLHDCFWQKRGKKRKRFFVFFLKTFV